MLSKGEVKSVLHFEDFKAYGNQDTYNIQFDDNK